MLYEGLAILRAELENYIRQNSIIASTEDEVVLGNIAQADGTTDASIKNKLVLSLIKIEEDPSLKNGPTRVFDGVQYKKENRPIYGYAYFMVAAHYPEGYANALKRLASAIRFFQGKNTFTHANSPLEEFDETEGIAEFKITVELVSPSFEQLNHIWGMMGGKSHPAAIYKARILIFKREAPQGSEEPITHIILNT
jgi:hypothetical protein